MAILSYSSMVYICETELQEQVAMQWRNTTIFVASNDTWTFVECFWWGLMTITTVGYESSPRTILGQVFAGFCALTGVFCLTLPIPIIVNSFAGFYKNILWKNEVSK